jgi:hypothetical protein
MSCKSQAMLATTPTNLGGAGVPSAHDAPYLLHELTPTTYRYVTAHDVPYREFICQVMMFLAQELFPKREMLPAKRHEV